MKRQKERPKRKETKEEEKEEESRNKSLSKRIRKKIGRKQKQSGVIITAIDTGERGEWLMACQEPRPDGRNPL